MYGAKSTSCFAQHEWQISAKTAADINDAECLELVADGRWDKACSTRGANCIHD